MTIPCKSLFFFIALSSALLGNWPGRTEVRQEIPPSPDTLAALAAGFSGIVTNEMLELREGVTLGQWLALHADDSLVMFGYELREVENEEWCMRAERRYFLPSGGIAERKAYFYAPLPPPGFSLPKLGDSLRVRTTEPVLGFIYVQLLEPVPGSGGMIADSVRQRLSGIFGIGRVDQELWGFGSAGWSHTNRWQSGTKIFASAFGVNLDHGRQSMIFAYGMLPISDVHLDFDYDDFSPGGKLVDLDSLIYQRTIQALGRYREDAGVLMRIYSDARNSRHPSISFKDVLSPFRDWLKLFQKTDPTTRATALVFADQVLKRIDGFFGVIDTSVLSQFRQLGAVIREGRTTGFIYESSWLTEARHLDPDGSMGDLALMIMMQRGFQLDASISDCGRCYIKIIREGEQLLTRSHDEELRTWIHFKLGYAYRDVVAIGRGFPTLTEEEGSFVMSAEVGAVNAIEHFRKALERDTMSTRASSAWREAWRLVASIPPKGTSFTFVDE